MNMKIIAAILLMLVIFLMGCSPSAELCIKKNTKLSMNFEEAKNIALNSPCVAEGTLKETYSCNENSGTWWIDLNIDKKGCSPACVVNIESRKAEINWRCI